MSIKDAYTPNLQKAGKMFGAAAGVVKTTAKKVVKKLMTEPDRTEGGKYRIDRVGNQLYKVKVKK